MRIPGPLLTANLVLAIIAIMTGIFALGLWLFVLNSKERSGQMQVTPSTARAAAEKQKFEKFFVTDNLAGEEEEQLRHVPSNQQVKPMGRPIPMDGMAPMGSTGRRKEGEEKHPSSGSSSAGPGDDDAQLQEGGGGAVDEPPFQQVLFKPLCTASGGKEGNKLGEQSTMC